MSTRDIDRTEALREEIVRGIVDQLGVPEALAMPYADSILTYLQREYPGQRLYIPAPTRQYDVQEIADALGRGASIARVCREHGISRPTLYRLFPDGLPLPSTSLVSSLGKD